MSCDLNPDSATPTAQKTEPQKPLGRWNLKPPTQRDLQIYKEVIIQRREQFRVAIAHELDASRICQIVKRVHRWLAAGGSPTDPQLRDHVARQRVSRATHKLRILRAVEMASFAMETQPPPNKTLRRRLVGSSELWREETTRPQPEVNLAAVRLMLRATEALQKMDEQDDLDDSPEPVTSERDLLPAVLDLLCRWRAQAEADGRLAPCPNPKELVAKVLDGLLGTQLNQEPVPAPTDKAADATDPLNLSADAPEGVATTPNQPASCGESVPDAAEKSSQLERPVAASDSSPFAANQGLAWPTSAHCVHFRCPLPASTLGGIPHPPGNFRRNVCHELGLRRKFRLDRLVAQPGFTPAKQIALVRIARAEQIDSHNASKGFEAHSAARKLPAADRPRFPPSTSTEGSMNAVSSLALLAILSVPGDPSIRQTPSAVPLTTARQTPPAADVTLLQFSSQKCQYCQSMQPIVAQLAQQGVNVQAVDVEQQLPVARQFQVSGVPTFIALSGNREIARIEGVTTYEKLAALVGWDKAAPAAAGPPSAPSPQPPAPSTLPPDQSARAATVRIKVEDATGYGFGTGTVIDTHDNEALVITCGHLFRESKGQGKITADIFATGLAQTVDGQLIGYDLDRDVALIGIRAPAALRAATVAPPGYTVRPGDRVFTIGCDKGADPSVRPTQITAVNKYKGKPNYTAAGQPTDGRSGGGLFSAEGYLIGICYAADPADNEGLYAGLASIHWQLDQIGQSEIYQRAALAMASTAMASTAMASTAMASGGREAPGGLAAPPAQRSRDTSIALASAQSPAPPALPVPQLLQQMPDLRPAMASGGREAPGQANREADASRSPDALDAPAPIVSAGDDAEIVFIIRSKRDPAQRSEVYVVDQAPPDLLARITHAARASGEQRAALARAPQPPVRTAAANQLPGRPPIVRGQTGEY